MKIKAARKPVSQLNTAGALDFVSLQTTSAPVPGQGYQKEYERLITWEKEMSAAAFSLLEQRVK